MKIRINKEVYVKNAQNLVKILFIIIIIFYYSQNINFLIII